MLKRLLVLIISLLLLTPFPVFAADTPPQPQMIGPRNVGAFPHVGTLLCIKENPHIGIYGDIKNDGALVFFDNGVATIAIVIAEGSDHYFVQNTPGTWESTTRKKILASFLVQTIEHVNECTEKMGLD